MQNKKANNQNELSDPEIEALVVKAQKGDADAFGKIYDHFIQSMYRYVFYKVNDKDVEDIVETLFMKAWENIGKYKNQKQKSFRAWIFRIAHNLVVDYYRMNREHSSLDPRISDKKRESDPADMAQLSLNNDYLRSAINNLKPNYQQIILLKFINELENPEIAKILKKSEGSVRILQFRALKALKQELEQMGISNLTP